MTLLLSIAGFICGSLMFSYWLGLLAKKNIRTVGDGNPGAANLWKAAGYKYGIAGVVLDFLKGYLPVVWLADSSYITGYGIIPIALSPILGHAFSPFLKFKGGKAIAVTFGVWAALTKFEVAILYAVILAVFQVIARIMRKGKPPSTETDSIFIVIGMITLAGYLYFKEFPAGIRWFWLGNLLVLLYTNWGDLSFPKGMNNREGRRRA